MKPLESLQTNLGTVLNTVNVRTAKAATSAPASGVLVNRLNATLASFQQTLKALQTQPATPAITSPTTPRATTATTAAAAAATTPAAATASAPAVATAPAEVTAAPPPPAANAGGSASTEYQAWLARQPVATGLSGVAYGQAVQAWQESSPLYINPRQYASFEGYLGAMEGASRSTTALQGANLNTAALGDPYRYESFLTSYYGTAATQNPWASCATAPSAQEQAGWSDSTRALYQRTVDASRSRAALVQAGLLPRG